MTFTDWKKYGESQKSALEQMRQQQQNSAAGNLRVYDEMSEEGDGFFNFGVGKIGNLLKNEEIVFENCDSKFPQVVKKPICWT